MTDQPNETELKFALSPDALDQLRWEVFGASAPHRLASTYYDTPDRRLSGRGLALRLRSDDGRWVQTLKASGAVSRFEDEVPVDGPTLAAERLRAPPAKLDDAGVEALSPVFEVRVERRTLDIAHGQSAIELALDDGAILAGGAEKPLLELELELKAGAMADLFGAARQLCLRPGVQLLLTSKAEQGFRLAQDRALEPITFHAPALAPDISVGEAFQLLASAALAQLCYAAGLVREADSPEAVHQARVALRRLRVLVGAFDEAVGDARIDAVKDELKRMTAIFADARSLDVFAEDAVPPPETGADVAALGGVVQRAQTAAHGRARAGVAAPRFNAGLIDLAEWIFCGAWTRAEAQAAARDARLAELADDLLSGRRRRMMKRGRRLDWADAHGRHKLRIQAKKMHYLIDALAPTSSGGHFYRRLKRLQTHLGDLNDIATADATARLALGDGAPMAVALAAGLIVGEQRARAPRLTRRAQRAFRKWVKEQPVKAG